jgi:hypothetical protein
MIQEKSGSAVLALAQGRSIDAADVIGLLREVYAGGVVSREDAEALIAFDRSLQESTPAWREFFAESITDHLLNRQEPAGAINEAKAAWLIARFAGNEPMATAAGFAVVMKLIEAAEPPVALSAFAILQLRLAVVLGEGPAIGRRPHFSRDIDADDVVLLARILEAGGGHEGRPVSREEAEALFDLHDAAAEGSNHPSFDDLFFKAIANHLTAAAGHTVAPRREVLMPDPRVAEWRSVFGRGHEPSEPGFRLPAGSAGSTDLGADELAWLSARIMRDGRPTAAEYALLRLFAQERSSDASLRRFLDNAA